MSDVTTLSAQVDGSVVSERLVAQLSSFFGLLALCLTCIGIYGVMTYAVTRRTNEIGLRMALGAARPRVLWLVMRESLVLVALGTALGLPISLALNRLASSALFGLGRIDWASIAVTPAVLLVVAAVAGFLPARRASNVDPMIALRHE